MDRKVVDKFWYQSAPLYYNPYKAHLIRIICPSRLLNLVPETGTYTLWEVSAFTYAFETSPQISFRPTFSAITYMSFTLIFFTWEEQICKPVGTWMIFPPATSLDFRLRSFLVANTQCNLVYWYSELGGYVPSSLNSNQSISIRLSTYKAIESRHLVSFRSVLISKASFTWRVSSKPYLKFFWLKSTRLFFLLPQNLRFAR